MRLQNRHIGFLAEDNYEDLEVSYPMQHLREAGARTSVVGVPGVPVYCGKHGSSLKRDACVDLVTPGDFDAIVIPGCDATVQAQCHPLMLDLVRGIFARGGIVAICRPGQMAISAGIVRGKRVTSDSSNKDELMKAGAQWTDEQVICDQNLISVRGPDDLPAFCQAIIDALAQESPFEAALRIHQGIASDVGQTRRAQSPTPPAGRHRWTQLRPQRSSAVKHRILHLRSTHRWSACARRTSR